MKKILFVLVILIMTVYGQNKPFTQFSHPSIVQINCVTSNVTPVNQYATDYYENKFKVGDYIPASVQVVRRDGADTDKLHVVTFNSDGSTGYSFNKTGRATTFISANPWNSSQQFLLDPTGPTRVNPQ